MAIGCCFLDSNYACAYLSLLSMINIDCLYCNISNNSVGRLGGGSEAEPDAEAARRIS